MFFVNRILREIPHVIVAEPERRFMRDDHVLARRGSVA